MNGPGKDPAYLEECTGNNIICTRLIHRNGSLRPDPYNVPATIIELSSD